MPEFLGYHIDGQFKERYEIGKPLLPGKSGGMCSRIFRVYDRWDGKPAVAKLPRKLENPEDELSSVQQKHLSMRSFNKMIEFEAHMLQDLVHPHIVKCLEKAYDASGNPALILEHLGEVISLQDLLHPIEEEKASFLDSLLGIRLLNSISSPTFVKDKGLVVAETQDIWSLSNILLRYLRRSHKDYYSESSISFRARDPQDRYLLSEPMEVMYSGIMMELVSAVDHLFANSISHNDIKADNVLIDAQRGVQLIDFGLATENSEWPIFGNRYYGPPDRFWDAETMISKRQSILDDETRDDLKEKIERIEADGSIIHLRFTHDFWNLAVLLCHIYTGRHIYAEGGGSVAEKVSRLTNRKSAFSDLEDRVQKARQSPLYRWSSDPFDFQSKRGKKIGGFSSIIHRLAYRYLEGPAIEVISPVGKLCVPNAIAQRGNLKIPWSE